MPSATRSPASSGRAGADVFVAWGAVVLMIALFVTVASVMTGVEWEPSFLVSMSILLAVLAALLALAWVAVRFGLQARDAGRTAGAVPAAIGATIGGSMLLLAIATLVAHLFGVE